MHRFSIIVPLFGDRRLFDSTLASILRFQPENSQIIVAHDGSYDDPYDLSGEIDLVATPPNARLEQLFNTAVNESTGDYVALIRPGIELGDDWNEPVEAEFEDLDVASVSPIVIASDRPKRIATAGVNHGIGFRRKFEGARSKLNSKTIRRISPLGPTSWAAFYRRSALIQLGICAEKMHSHYLDLDIALSLETIGWDTAFCPDCVVHVDDSEMIENELALPHGCSAQRAYRRYADLSASNSWLLRSAGAFAQEMICSPFQTWKLRHAMGRLAAWKTAKQDRNFARHLSAVAFEIEDEPANPIHENQVENDAIDSTDRRAA